MGCVIKYKGQSIPEEQFLQYLNKQIAINNLFNENESLANTVYKALGFKTESSSNTITRDIKEELPFKVIGNYNEIDEGLIGRKFYEEKIGNDLYRFEISNYSYPNEDSSSESFYDIDFTVNGSEEVIGTGFFDKAERAKQILQALLSQNFGNDTVRFNVEESKKGKQRLSLYKRLMNQLGYNPSEEMEYTLFYDIKTDKVNLTPQQKQQALQLYSQYLDTIFPDSQVKDIVYHGTNNPNFSGFGSDFSRAIHFGTLQAAKDRRSHTDFEFKNNAKFIPVLLNVKNPLKTKQDFNFEGDGLEFVDDPDFDFTKEEGHRLLITYLHNKGYNVYHPKGGVYRDGEILNNAGLDSVIYKNEREDKGNYSYAVFEPEQIHVLGSKLDIQTFKDFMAFENSEFSKYGTYQQFRDFIINKSSIEIENKLIETSKINRVC